ncbi:MAG: NAD(P)(+) transhydrogenase (Re/Si-specific) subunit beta [Gammaproteobacteria bacterium]|nr:NAD(P)(+) transhydrogenase (Re/Si-specific) subunit beta [Gammaproteobacteria bacterium]NNJ83635.1 NAD(P)(+) transhydrogenase (Re/Si-specific) subunit beta [Gammaproteobacteria bacterium]
MALSIDTLAFAYLVSAILFILGLKGLTSPATARRGSFQAIVGMIIAVAVTLLSPEISSAIRPYGIIAIAVIIGAAIGITVAIKIQMTAMPQLVAMLHSFVGLAAVLVAIGTFINKESTGGLNPVLMGELAAGIVIGAITFTGSLIAFGKLQAILSSAPVVFTGQHWLNLALGVIAIVFAIHFGMTGSYVSLAIVTIISLALGFLLIIPIGGADMPVVISMLNSYSGWAAAATGFTLQNNLLIVTGALVGFSGAIISYIMCRAMNRSFISVILGGFGVAEGGEASPMAAAAEKGVKAAGVEDAVFWMDNEGAKVIVVPGYGMAVAQAQHALKEVKEILAGRGVSVKFAIHPVAGRMPGHMNVLLAEADIPYDQVLEMDEINPEFPSCDVAIVVGANDVTNPAAKIDPTSDIYGMPILDVEKAKQIFVIKRSMRPGYAGVDNLLYYRDNCSMLFGDAKEMCEGLAGALKGGH